MYQSGMSNQIKVDHITTITTVVNAINHSNGIGKRP